jgi:alanine dehydrogenase
MPQEYDGGVVAGQTGSTWFTTYDPQENWSGMMNIGVPHERRTMEYRVGLTPAGIELLAQEGHTCYVEREAGLGAGFSDYDYERAGARIVYTPDEVFGRADLLLKVTRPIDEEMEWVPPGQIMAGFFHLASARRVKVTMLLDKRVTAIAYEMIQKNDGSLPVLKPMSQVGGRMIAQIGATLLQNNHGGKGILVGGVPGVPPAEVVIIGAGTAGTEAARTFLGMGASVYMLDKDLEQLQKVDHRFGGRVITMVSHNFNIAKVVRFADILIGAVLVPGKRAPILVTREMVRSMRPRSVVMDMSIDQGGCMETSRPTTHASPTYVEEGILHYCVPNVSGVIARTATHAFNNAAWPHIQNIVRLGLDEALNQDPALARGLATRDGDIVHPAVRAAYEASEC